MKKEELIEILDKHLKWLNNKEGGERANLRSANLEYADLYGANLQNADLQNANLRNVDLQDADLRNANLQDANLRNANLRDVDLRDANLQDADLYGANLYGANLQDADLWNADLRNIKNADKLQDLLISYTSICPEGTIIGWKKCRNNVVVKLEIPAEAKRSNSTGRKCRAEYVRVLEVIGAKIATSQHDSTVIYEAGKIIYPDKWDEDRWNECSHGIHFFITKLEAEKY